MIAYRCQYEPTLLRAVKLIRDGSLGKIQSIESAFGFNEVAGEWRLNKKLAGGGPLYDVGIYSLNACRFFTGEEPSAISGYTSVIDHDGRFDEVEENVVWNMKFPSGIVASCATTYGAQMDGYLRIQGSKGSLELDPAFNYDGVHLRGRYSGTQIEADHFSNCVLNNVEPKTPGEEGLRDMRHITEIYRSAGISI
jgi:predicted dehydrogenase